MSIEFYLAVNLIADFALLGSVSRALGLFDWRRALSASLACSAYAVLAATRPTPWASPVLQLCLLAAVALIITRNGSAYARWVAALSLCASALISGGLASLTQWTGPSGAAVGVGSGALLTTLLFAARPPCRNAWQVRLCLCMNGKTARFEALIDTGNRLREPASGLPVLIAESSLLRDLLPESGYRQLRFGALGGSGQLACFKPGCLWIERGGRRQRAPEVWVAVSYDPLPGLCQALAPPEFALYSK